jgi:1-aminocyclopropane-1-carboxylate deaminase
MIKDNSINQKLVTLDPINLSVFTEKEVEVKMLRIDKIHPIISGNKWFKLRHYLIDAVQQNKLRVLTYGGAWSNHIVATASACKEIGLEAIGVIRGEEPANYSRTLLEAKSLGMKLIFLSREDFKNKILPQGTINESTYEINEGGYGALGAKGASEILTFTKGDSFSHVICAVGTGTMMAGLINGSTIPTEIIGISVLKNNNSLEEEIKQLCNKNNNNWKLLHGFDEGGYAKHHTALIDFMNAFYTDTNIPTDFVYTAKLCKAVISLATENYFPAGSKLLLIHSGGLQGNQSLNKGVLAY